MAIATLKELVEAGVHFGARAARWDPAMKPFIHSKQGGIHIIDLKESVKGLIRASYFLRKVAASRKKVLFVGTKRQASDVVRQEASRAGSFFVAHRWLGGTLTNMKTMRNRVVRLKELEDLEESGQIHSFSKKMVSSLTRERKKIFRNFEGIRDMKELPGALVVIDPEVEQIAVKEAIKLGIPTIAIVDTDTNPEPIDFVIPGNDDSLRSIQYLIGKLADAVIQGSGKVREQAQIEQRKRDEDGAEAPVKEDDGIDVPDNISEMGAFSMGDD